MELAQDELNKKFNDILFLPSFHPFHFLLSSSLACFGFV
jgi:hypothetical protein